MSSQVFPWQVRVYYEDTDCGGIVYNANYLRFFERARTEMLRSLGWKQRELAQAGICQFVVVEAKVKFRKPAYLDDVLDIETRITGVRRASFEFHQIARRGTEVIAEGTVRAACVKPATGAPIPFPADLLEQARQISSEEE